MKIKSDKKSVEELLKYFSRTTDEVFSLGEFKKMLLSGRQLRMKFGMDVTAANLHIGHAVNFWMYRKLQDLGHKMVFLVGDFTTKIGDPTGKSETRPIIPEKEIKKNSEEFIRQAMMVLRDDPKLVEVRRNSEWYDKMSAEQLLSLMSLVTHNRLLTRDMFQKRVKEQREIYEHELVYPILQGYDSVMLKSDLTIVGSDQLYNEMMGRFFQEKFGQPPQVVLTTKITPGIDGREKQSKSLGNYIGLKHSAREKFGRVMSIPDNLIIDYFKIYTELPLKEIEKIEKDMPAHPMEAKLRLAAAIVARYHGQKTAAEEKKWFQNTFSEGKTPKEIPKIQFGKKEAAAFNLVRKCFSSKEKSNSQIRRLFQQGAIKVNGKTVEEPKEKVKLVRDGVVLKVGKRQWFRVFP